jgi:hypothetical protein
MLLRPIEPGCRRLKCQIRAVTHMCIITMAASFDPSLFLSRCAQLLAIFETASSPDAYTNEDIDRSALIILDVCIRASHPDSVARPRQQQLLAQRVPPLLSQLARAVTQTLNVALQHLDQLSGSQCDVRHALLVTISKLAFALGGLMTAWPAVAAGAGGTQQEHEVKAARWLAEAGTTKHACFQLLLLYACVCRDRVLQVAC